MRTHLHKIIDIPGQLIARLPQRRLETDRWTKRPLLLKGWQINESLLFHLVGHFQDKKLQQLPENVNIETCLRSCLASITFMYRWVGRFISLTAQMRSPNFRHDNGSAIQPARSFKCSRNLYGQAVIDQWSSGNREITCLPRSTRRCSNRRTRRRFLTWNVIIGMENWGFGGTFVTDFCQYPDDFWIDISNRLFSVNWCGKSFVGGQDIW